MDIGGKGMNCHHTIPAKECPICFPKEEKETFEEKLERKLQESIRKHGVRSFEPAPSESNDA